MIVLDASMALAWIFERENKKEVAVADRVLEEMLATPVIVPTLWHTEIANALLVGERRKVISEAQIIDYLNRLSHLPITTDSRTPASATGLVMSLGREFNLTAYDATYLELALQHKAVLATFDAALSQAMKKAGGEMMC